jgi:hypothetical protein
VVFFSMFNFSLYILNISSLLHKYLAKIFLPSSKLSLHSVDCIFCCVDF